MLRLFTTYKAEAQAEYQSTLAIINSTPLQHQGIMSKQLSDIFENIRRIDEALIKYEDERVALEKDIRARMGLTPRILNNNNKLKNKK